MPGTHRPTGIRPSYFAAGVVSSAIVERLARADRSVAGVSSVQFQRAFTSCHRSKIHVCSSRPPVSNSASSEQKGPTSVSYRWDGARDFNSCHLASPAKSRNSPSSSAASSRAKSNRTTRELIPVSMRKSEMCEIQLCATLLMLKLIHMPKEVQFRPHRHGLARTWSGYPAQRAQKDRRNSGKMPNKPRLVSPSTAYPVTSWRVPSIAWLPWA